MIGMSWSELLGSPSPHTGLDILEDAVDKSPIYNDRSILDLQQPRPLDADGPVLAAISIPTRAWFPSWRKIILSSRIRNLMFIAKSFVHKS